MKRARPLYLVTLGPLRKVAERPFARLSREPSVLRAGLGAARGLAKSLDQFMDFAGAEPRFDPANDGRRIQ